MTFDDIYRVVKSIPLGKVSTYGDIAKALCAPRGARVVGWALHCNPEARVIPCHRVVKQDGSLSEAFRFGGENIQRQWLAEEGVEFSPEGRVIMAKFRYGF